MLDHSRKFFEFLEELEYSTDTLEKVFKVFSVSYGRLKIDEVTGKETSGLLLKGTDIEAYTCPLISKALGDENERKEDEIGLKMTSLAEKIEKTKMTMRDPALVSKPSLLPPMKSKYNYTLVLDLDETLIHYKEEEGEEGQFYIRPFARDFLKEMGEFFEIVIFTAATKDVSPTLLTPIVRGLGIEQNR